jgi:hypothetical protein
MMGWNVAVIYWKLEYKTKLERSLNYKPMKCMSHKENNIIYVVIYKFIVNAILNMLWKRK